MSQHNSFLRFCSIEILGGTEEEWLALWNYSKLLSLPFVPNSLFATCSAPAGRSMGLQELLSEVNENSWRDTELFWLVICLISCIESVYVHIILRVLLCILPDQVSLFHMFLVLILSSPWKERVAYNNWGYIFSSFVLFAQTLFCSSRMRWSVTKYISAPAKCHPHFSPV